jgi:inosose dehydratase
MIERDESDGQLRIATCPVNWNNNDLIGWRPVTPFPIILDRMREAGYRATEYDGSFGPIPAVVKDELRSRGMQLTGSYQWVDFLAHGGEAEAYDDLRPMLRFLADIECRNLIVSDPLRTHRVALAGRVPVDGSESLDDASYARIADGIHTLGKIASDYGIHVRYHNHVGSWIEAPHELDALLRHLDTSHADLCFDTGHYAYGGGNPCQFISDNIDSIGYLHLKDVDSSAIVDARARELTFLEALREIVFAPIGTGTADIAGILATLVEHRFDGWVVVEQDTCSEDPGEAARTNLAFIQQSLDAHHIVGR